MEFLKAFFNTLANIIDEHVSFRSIENDINNGNVSCTGTKDTLRAMAKNGIFS